MAHMAKKDKKMEAGILRRLGSIIHLNSIFFGDTMVPIIVSLGAFVGFRE